MPERPIKREEYGLPPRLFLYTTDQIALMLAIDEARLKREFLHYDGRSPGARPFKKMLARNIAPEGDPEWRVLEDEFIRWMKFKGFKVYSRGWATR